jgi:DNA-binding HxlR family transcriptional regulator
MVTMTAGQRRSAEQAAYDAFLATCPARQVLGVISDKWTGLVVVALLPGPRRYSELRREIAGVSQKMLTQTLRSLERDGMVTRTVTAGVPVRVDYELTPLGERLGTVLRAVKVFAEANIAEITAARAAYDARADG